MRAIPLNHLPKQIRSSSKSIGQAPNPVSNATIVPHAFAAPTGIIYAGDSRVANAGGISGTWLATKNLINGAIGLFSSSVGNKVVSPPTYNYGVGGSTTLSLLYRLNAKNNGTTGNPANGFTSVGTDANWNSNSSNEYGMVSHPANCIFILDSVNDSSASSYYTSPIVSMKIIAACLDQLRGQTVFLSNEIPRGFAWAAMESHTVTSHTCTATNTSGFQDGSLITHINGTLSGVYGVISNTGAPYSLVTAGNEVAGVSYSVTSGGVYTFNSSDTITTAFLNYSYSSTASAAYQITMHEWLQSSASTFYEGSSAGAKSVGYNYGIPGALFRRPWVVSVDTWGAVQDPNNLNYNLRGTSYDGLHPSPYGGQLHSSAFATAFNKIFPNAVSQMPLPNTNNMQFATGNNSTTTFTATLPASMLPVQPGTLTVWQGSVIGYDNKSGGITGTGIASGTINYSSGAISVTFSSAPGTNVKIYASCDYGNLLENGLLDINTILASSAASGATSGNIPRPWTTSITNLGSCHVDITQTTDDNGYPGVLFTFSPNSGVLGTGPTCQIVSPTINDSRVVAGNVYRSTANIKIMAGTNGVLCGLYGIGLSQQIQSSAGVTKPGSSSATIFKNQDLLGTSSHPLTNNNLINGSMQYMSTTTSNDTTGFTSPSITLNIVFGLATGWPVSAKVLVSRCAIRAMPSCSMEY